MIPPRTTELLIDLTPPECRALARAANLLGEILGDQPTGVAACESGAMKLEVALVAAGEEPS